MLRLEAGRYYRRQHEIGQTEPRAESMGEPALEVSAEYTSDDTGSRDGTEVSKGRASEDERVEDNGKGEAAPGGAADCSEGERETVLLDVRNVYETSIGHFRSVSPSLWYV